MYLTTTIRILLILVSFIPSVVLAEPKWYTKPVQCGPIKEVEQLVKDHNEVAIFGAISKVSVDESNLNTFIEAPVYLFYKAEEKTFTFIEFNYQGEIACIISWGGNVDFDVQKYFE
jgi:hypothetical protein